MSSGELDSTVVAGVVGNIVSVVGVVITNKYIVGVDGFDFMVFLSFLHFSFTTLGTRMLLYGKYFEYKDAAFNNVLPVSMGSLLSVAFMNLNLSHNSVGFYQLSKLVCIPITLAIQYFAYNQSVSRLVQFTLLPILFGVGFATVYDIEVHTIGLVFASFAVVATALAQIFTNTYQKSLDCNAMQLLYHSAPVISVGMLLMCPLFDDLGKLMEYEFTSDCVFRIILSCFFALGVNISNYLVLGKTSPLTYQVLGHLKTILILVLGFTVFNKPLDARNCLGITIAMVGVIAYTEIKRRQQVKLSALPK
jgi:solute carrier family 35 protein E3